MGFRHRSMSNKKAPAGRFFYWHQLMAKRLFYLKTASFHRAKAQANCADEITSVVCPCGDFIGQPAATGAST